MQKIGPYTIENRLGAGGHGVVYRSTHPVLGRPVAVKVLHDAFARDAALRERFLGEARLALELSHPGIVNVYDIGQSGEQLFIVMELFEHGSLADALAQQRIPLPVALDVAAEIADALGYAHSRGVLHSDIKPSNVLLRADGSTVLADFGLATDLTARSSTASSAEPMGTPEYLAPEQIEGRRADARSDVYQFGVLLYELIAGRLPFDGTVHQVINGHLRQPPRPLRDIDATVPAEVDALVGEMLAKDPAQRPPDIATVSARLSAMRGNRPAAHVATGSAGQAATGPTVRLSAPGQVTYQQPTQVTYQQPTQVAYQQPAQLVFSVGTPSPPPPAPQSQSRTGADAFTLFIKWLILGLFALTGLLALMGVFFWRSPASGGAEATSSDGAIAVAASSPEGFMAEAGAAYPAPEGGAAYPAPSTPEGGAAYPAPEAGGAGQTVAPADTSESLPLALTMLPEPLLTDPQSYNVGQEQWTIASVGTYHEDTTIHIYGVVRYDGQGSRHSASVHVVMRDEAGAELRSQTEALTTGSFEPGEFGAFWISFHGFDSSLPAEGSYSTTFALSSQELRSPADRALRNLVVSDVSYRSLGDGTYEWSATISGAPGPLSFAVAQAIYFDDSGRVVGLSYALPDTQASQDQTTGTAFVVRGGGHRFAKAPSSLAVVAEGVPVP